MGINVVFSGMNSSGGWSSCMLVCVENPSIDRRLRVSEASDLSPLHPPQQFFCWGDGWEYEAF